MNNKPYYIGILSFIFSLIGLLPYPFIFINFESIRYIFFIDSISNLAGYSVWFGLITGIYAIYKIKKDKLNGFKYALIGTLISAILLLTSFVILIVSSP